MSRLFGVSDFDEWLGNNHPGTVLRDGEELLDADLGDMEAAYNAGREGMIKKSDVLAMVNSCLVRDPTLQKLVKQIEELE